MIRKRKSRLEEQHQVAFVTWFRKQYPQYAKLLTLGSFGENIGERRMARLKQMGLTPGFPDLFLAIPKAVRKRNGQILAFFCGLYIEMKTKRGKVTEVQKEMHTMLLENGFVVHIARDWEQACEYVRSYLRDY